MLSGGNYDVQHKANAKQQQLVCPQLSSECSTGGFPGLAAAPQPSSLPAVLAAGAPASFQAANPRSSSSHPSCALYTLVSSTPPLRGWGRASWPWAGAGVRFYFKGGGRGRARGGGVHVSMVSKEGAWDPQSCPMTLCYLVPQLSAGCRARMAGAASSPIDAPAHPAGWDEPARQVLAMPLPSRLPAARRAPAGSSKAAVGLWRSSAHRLTPWWGQGPPPWLLAKPGATQPPACYPSAHTLHVLL